MSFKSINHHELELKFELEEGQVLPQEFLSRLCLDFEVEKVKIAISPDVYYRQGDNVLRFRSNRDHVGGELTVKLRTSDGSITNRVEVDLPLSKKATDRDVRAFLKATGWVPELHLEKSSHIVHVGRVAPQGGDPICPPTVIALYTVSKKGTGIKRTFMEVELNKDGLKSTRGAQKYLDSWHEYFIQAFTDFPTEAKDQSLYEMYTGKLYRTA